MFSITSYKAGLYPAKGFQMTFANGWTVSIQFGQGNYCDNKYTKEKHIVPDCINAEIAAWDANGIWHDFGNDTVKGYCSPDEVAVFIAEISAIK